MSNASKWEASRKPPPRPVNALGQPIRPVSAAQKQRAKAWAPFQPATPKGAAR